MMRLLLAESMLAWHRASRGVTLWAMILLLPILLWWVPGIGEDGLIRTRYCLSLVWALFVLVALWCGGTAYALDRERNRLTLTFTKPCSRWALWWGRCLGSMLPFALGTVLVWSLLGLRPLPEGRQLCQPILPDLAERSQHELLALQAKGLAPENVSQARLLRAVEDALRQAYTELPTASSRTYQFTLPDHLPEDANAAFRLSGAPFLGAVSQLRLQITILCDGQSATLTPSQLPERGIEIALPKGFVKSGKPCSVQLTRLDHHPASSILYREYEDLTLLVSGQHPLLNLTMVMSIFFLTLVMAVALGTALGCTFSLPVTLFVGTMTLLAMAAAAFAPETTVMEEQSSWFATASTAIAHTVARPIQSLVNAQPLQALFEGEALSWRTVSGCFWAVTLPWLVVMSLLSIVTRVKDKDA